MRNEVSVADVCFDRAVNEHAEGKLCEVFGEHHYDDYLGCRAAVSNRADELETDEAKLRIALSSMYVSTLDKVFEAIKERHEDLSITYTKQSLLWWVYYLEARLERVVAQDETHKHNRTPQADLDLQDALLDIATKATIALVQHGVITKPKRNLGKPFAEAPERLP